MNDMNKQMHYVLYHSDETDVSVNAVVQNDSNMGGCGKSCVSNI